MKKIKILSLLLFSMLSANAQLLQLKQFYSAERKDYFATCTAKGEEDALSANYVYQADEGLLSPNNGDCKKPLLLFFHGQTGDNVVASEDQRNMLQSAGYTYIRVEGYMWKTNETNCAPLKLYFNRITKDYTVANSNEANDYLTSAAAGYEFKTIRSSTCSAGHVEVR